MLVLLSFALVLVATVLLVLGLLNDGLGLIYVSIASSVAAAAVLIAALRLNKTRTSDESATTPSLSQPEPVPAAAAADEVTASIPTSGTDWLAAEPDWPAEGDDDDDDGEAEVDFPIADYDSLSIAQILPLLPQLYSDEIDVVEEREQETKARPKILAKLAELRDASGAADPLATYTEDPSDPSDAPDWDDEDWFPIEDYESLSAAQILALLPELDSEELTLVRTRELSLSRRRSLLDEIDRTLGASTKKAAAKKKAAPAKKAPAKKAAKKATRR